MQKRRLGISRILVTTLGIWRRHALYLWLLAAIVLLPLAVFELAGRAVSVRIDTNSFDVGDFALGLCLVVLLQFTGEEIYAGACEHIVTEDQRGEEPQPLGALVARLPLVRMTGAAVLYSVVFAIGLALFVVPGLILATVFSVVGPALVIERIGVMASFRRSFQLVRGHFWGAFTIVVATFLATEGISDLIAAGVHELGAPRWLSIVTEFGGEALLMPFSGVAFVVLYLVLVELRAGTESKTGPPLAGP